MKGQTGVSAQKQATQVHKGEHIGSPLQEMT